MDDNEKSILNSLRLIDSFTGQNLSKRIGGIESDLVGCDVDGCRARCDEVGVNPTLFAAASDVKRVAGQIDVIVHAVGGMLLLSKILEPGEVVQNLSLGAGTAGKPFDIETDRRVAELKFIRWRGGSESIRQNSIFKDFYNLAEYPTTKRKELYVLDAAHPIRFFNNNRALHSVMSKNNKLWTEFQSKYSNRYQTVSQYYSVQQSEVEIIDILKILPELLYFNLG